MRSLMLIALMQCTWAQEELPSAADQEVVPVKSSKFNATDLDTISLKYCQNIIFIFHRSSRALASIRNIVKVVGRFLEYPDIDYTLDLAIQAQLKDTPNAAARDMMSALNEVVYCLLHF